MSGARATSEPVTLRERAYDAFTQSLLANEIRAGQFLSQRELVAITKMPLGAIRELIPRLEAEGLIITVPQRGMQIAHVDLKLIRNAFQLRLILEREATLRFATEASDAQLAELRNAHQEIVDEANNPNSPIRLKALVLDDEVLERRTVTVVAAPTILGSLGINAGQSEEGSKYAGPPPVRAFDNPEAEKVAQLAYEAIRKLSRSPGTVPDISYISRPDVQAQLVREVQSQYRQQQMELEGVAPPPPDFAKVIAKTAALVVDRTINIPRISVSPTGEAKAGFRPFTLDLSSMTYAAPEETLWAQYLGRNEGHSIGMSQGNFLERRPEDYVVSGLIDFPEVSYDDNADLLYDLAGQVVRHFHSYLSAEDTLRLLQLEQPNIARAVHAQMLEHFWMDDTVEYQHVVTSGFTEIKQSAHSAERGKPLDYRSPPADKSNMARYLFGGFTKCLTNVARFHSDSERKLAVILEREAEKWFRPAKGQFQMFYRKGSDHLEYRPDFVAETADEILMLEPKMATQMDDADVLAKRDVAVQWCRWASEHARRSGGKRWRYALIPHDQIADNMGLDFFLKSYACS